MTDLPQDMQAHNRSVIDDFRGNGAPEGRRLLLLTTTGAKSGEKRTTPLMYVPDGERILVIAANAGSAHHPGWYHNLLADPVVRVEVGSEDYPATATALSGAEHDSVFAWIATDYPFFAEYQARVERTIPVVALTHL